MCLSVPSASALAGHDGSLVRGATAGQPHLLAAGAFADDLPFPPQALYMFYALAIVCDDFFVPSLEKICEVRRGDMGSHSQAGQGDGGPGATKHTGHVRARPRRTEQGALWW